MRSQEKNPFHSEGGQALGQAAPRASGEGAGPSAGGSEAPALLLPFPAQIQSHGIVAALLYALAQHPRKMRVSLAGSSYTLRKAIFLIMI